MATKLKGYFNLTATKECKEAFKEYTFTRGEKEGQKEISLFIEVVPMMKVDDRGNTHCIVANVPTGEVDENLKKVYRKVYLGRLQPEEFGNGTTTAPQSVAPQSAPHSVPPQDDLPF